VREVFEVELPLRALFQQPTIAEFAVRISERQPAAATIVDLRTSIAAMSLEEVNETLRRLKLEQVS